MLEFVFVHFLWYMNHPCLYLKGLIESYPSFFCQYTTGVLFVAYVLGVAPSQ